MSKATWILVLALVAVCGVVFLTRKESATNATTTTQLLVGYDRQRFSKLTLSNGHGRFDVRRPIAEDGELVDFAVMHNGVHVAVDTDRLSLLLSTLQYAVALRSIGAAGLALGVPSARLSYEDVSGRTHEVALFGADARGEGRYLRRDDAVYFVVPTDFAESLEQSLEVPPPDTGAQDVGRQDLEDAATR